MSSGGEKEHYIKYELIGGGSPRHLDTFSNFFMLAVRYRHQYMLCDGDCSHVVQNTRTYHALLLLLTAAKL